MKNSKSLWLHFHTTFLLIFFLSVLACSQEEPTEENQESLDETKWKVTAPVNSTNIEQPKGDLELFNPREQAELWLQQHGLEEGRNEHKKNILFIAIGSGESELECAMEGLVRYVIYSGINLNSIDNNGLLHGNVLINDLKINMFSSISKEGNDRFDMHLLEGDAYIARYESNSRHIDFTDIDIEELDYTSKVNIEPDPSSNAGKELLSKLKEKGIKTKCFWNEKHDLGACVLFITEN